MIFERMSVDPASCTECLLMSRTDISIIGPSYSTADTAFPALPCSAMVNMGVSAIMRTNSDIGIVASANEPSRLVAP